MTQNNKTNTREEFITRSGLLKERGWTDSLIKKFLSTPDKTEPNPRYKNAGAPMKLYQIKRVETIESSGEFQKEYDKCQTRKQSACRAVTTKKTSLLRQAENIQFDMPIIEKSKLIELAVDDYNARADVRGLERGDFNEKWASPDDDPGFICRLCVNYLRHRACPYDLELDNVKNKVGVREAYRIIKQKALQAIAQKYAWLEEETENQLSKIKRGF